MPNDPQAAYEFGQFTLVRTEKRLLCDGKAIPLAPKVFDTLVLLPACFWGASGWRTRSLIASPLAAQS